MQKKIIFICALFLILTIKSFGQYKNIDSLKSQLTTASGINKANILNLLARAIYTIDISSAQKYLDDLETVSKSLNYEQGLINSKLVSAKFDIQKRTFDNTLSKLKTAREQASTTKQRKLETEALYLMANYYQETNKLSEIDEIIAELGNYKSRDGLDALGRAVRSKGYYYYFKGDFAGAKNEFARALDIFKPLNDQSLTIRTEMLEGVAEYKMGSVKNSVAVLVRAVAEARKISDSVLIADCLTNLAISEYGLGNINNSLKCQEEANAIYLRIKNMARYQSGIVNLANNLIALNRMDEALTYLFNTLDEVKKSKDYNLIGSCYALIGDVNLKNRDTVRAQQYFNEQLTLAREKKLPVRELSSLRNLGQIEIYRNHIEKALEYLSAAEAICVKLNIIKEIDAVYVSLGNAYKQKKDYVKAEEYYQKCYEIAKATDSKIYMAGMLHNIGILNFDQNNFDKAIEYYKNALKIREELQHSSGISDTYLTLSNAYYQKKDFEKSYEYYRKYHLLQDSLSKLTSKKSLTEMQTKYDMKEKEQQINLLSKDQKLKTLLLDQNKKELMNQELLNDKKRAEIELLNKDKIINENDLKASRLAESEKQKELEIANKDKIIIEKEARRQKQVRYIFTGGFAIALVLALFILRGYIQKRKANTIISIQKKEVEEQNLLIIHQKKEITDSINYAQRIQGAILPHNNDIAISDYFILYKPKDIVSGDFYFYQKTHTGYIIAVADCTGHGVPGAFMSLIGSKELNDITKRIKDPGKILAQLNQAIKNTLKQNKEEATRDGMDIVIIHVDGTHVLYSGANRPLWYVEKSDGILKEVKATKHAIGGLTSNDQEFDQHSFEFKKGDVLYLSSDGFADQFGGDKGKKLTTKKMKDDLMNIFSKSMKEQRHYLDQSIENWRGDIEQLDDICVVGIRI